MMFFDADGGEGGGGEGAPTAGGEGSKGNAVFDAPSLVGPAKSSTGDPTPPSGGEGDGGGEGGSGTGGAGTGEPEGGAGTGEGAAPKGGTVDAVALAKEFGGVLGEHLKTLAPQAPAAPPMSKEEAQKLLKVWNPTKEWQTKFDNLETRDAAIQEMRDGLVVQADTLAQLRMQEFTDNLMKKLSPQLDAVRVFQDQQRDDRFHKAYPQLANPSLKPLLDAVTDGLVKQGKRFPNEQEAFKALASGVEAVIKVNNPDFKLTAGSSPADNNNGREGNSIPVTTPGSRGGVGGGGRQTTAPKSRGLAIFDR